MVKKRRDVFLNQHECKWNSTSSKKWEGYCLKDCNFNDKGEMVSGPLIKCKGLPCEYFELGE